MSKMKSWRGDRSSGIDEARDEQRGCRVGKGRWVQISSGASLFVWNRTSQEQESDARCRSSLCATCGGSRDASRLRTQAELPCGNPSHRAHPNVLARHSLENQL